MSKIKFVVLGLILFLVGCTDSNLKFDDEFIAKVVDIQIIICTEEYDDSGLEYEVVKEIDEKDESFFLEKFSKIEYNYLFGQPFFFQEKKKYIKLDFNDGTYGIYGDNFLCYFDQDHNWIMGWSRYDEKDIINELITEYYN